MQNYQSKFLKSRGLDASDFIACEFCGKQAEDIHHILSSYRWERTCFDDWSDLIAVCRDCHEYFTKHATHVLRKNLLFLVAWIVHGSDFFE